MLGGKIVVQSKYGEGSKFTVYIKQKIITLNKPDDVEAQELIFNVSTPLILGIISSKRIKSYVLPDFNFSIAAKPLSQESASSVSFFINCLNEGDYTKFVISVEDTGRGIKPEQIDKLFL